MSLRIPPQVRRWLAEPHLFVVAVTCMSILFGAAALFVQRVSSAPTLDAAALSKARNGVIIMNPNEPGGCKQVQFDNQNVAVGDEPKPKPTPCEATSDEAKTGTPIGNGHLGIISQSFRGR
jgi:hypothetical protein